ncbi:MAG: coenzyme F420-0:L-glutamate ligase, partial [Actinobacteria bacterium]|nr:coenzyme F420-0:L-glutamate ligase [Actinomycetota bacterium]
MLTVLGVEGLGEVRPGDDLAALVAGAVELRAGDVVVVAQKVVSKAEGALVRPAPGEPREVARRRVARAHTARLVARVGQTEIVQTVHGLVCANAGVDGSNVPDGRLTLLPADPDASARRLRDGLLRRTGERVAVIVADTFGRPWRLGQTDVAIGVAGLRPVRDERGGADRHGRTLDVTEVAVADELAGAADLVRTKAAGVPVVVVRGFTGEPDDAATARTLVRPPAEDLFRRGRGLLADSLPGPGEAGGDAPPGPRVRPDDLARALRAAERADAGRVR